MRILGKAFLPIKCNNYLFPFDFYVIDEVTHDCILGVPFLVESKAQIDMCNKTVTFDDKVVLNVEQNLRTLPNQVCTLRSYTLPARSETLVPVFVKNASLKYNTICLVEPFPVSDQRYLCAKTLVRMGYVVVRLLNLSNEVIEVKGATVLGTLHEVEPKSICAFTDYVNTVNSPATPSPPKILKPSKPKYSMEQLGIKLENENLTPEQKSALTKLIEGNSDVFALSMADLQRTTLLEMEIDTGDAQPIRQRGYRHAPQVNAEITRQTNELQTYGQIEPSVAFWNFPCLLVKKKAAGEMRLCIDYRKLNAITKVMSFPLPTIPEIFDTMAEAAPMYFSLLDLRAGFHQVPIKESDRDKTTFSTTEGQFRFTCMPFGLRNAPLYFQMLVNQVFRGLIHVSVMAYIDDILVYSRTWEDHLRDLDVVFDRIRQANLRVHNKKCSFAVPEVLYLGHVLKPNGMCVDENKVKVVKNWPKPKNVRDVRAFLGLCGYYRRFVKDYAKITTSLNNLLRKDQPFIWDQACEDAFQTLKTAVTTTPILTYPRMDKPFIISCDASVTSIGFILSQIDESTNLEKPIVFGGRSLRNEERRWAITDLEALAMVEAFREFRPYIQFSRVIVYTDHIALQWIQNLHNKTGRLFRWAMLLQGYNFEIRHKPGKAHTNADAISRMEHPPAPPQDPNDELLEEILAVSAEPPLVVGNIGYHESVKCLATPPVIAAITELYTLPSS